MSLTLVTHGVRNGAQSGNLGVEEILGFPGGSGGKESTCDAGDQGSVPGSS